jgi:hypothetical protein
LLISTDKVVAFASADDAKPAMRPITVPSPVLKTIPMPVPAVHIVPKNATFADSKILATFKSTYLSKSSDSPVNEALLTFISLA